MKVYQVVKSYYDGDHEHGSYRSPLFASREDAEAFRGRVNPRGETVEEDANSLDDTRWWSAEGFHRQRDPKIVEHEIVEDWDGDVPTAREARRITFT